MHSQIYLIFGTPAGHMPEINMNYRNSDYQLSQCHAPWELRIMRVLEYKDAQGEMVGCMCLCE